MRRDDICLYLGPTDRAELQALIVNRNTPRKPVWRAEIVLATAEGHGTFEIMRWTRTSKPTDWLAWYLDEGVAGLKRAKTRSSREPPPPMATRPKVIAMTVQETPPDATHRSRALMAEAIGISPSSGGRISSPRTPRARQNRSKQLESVRRGTPEAIHECSLGRL